MLMNSISMTVKDIAYEWTMTTQDFFIHWLKPNIATKISHGLKFT